HAFGAGGVAADVVCGPAHPEFVTAGGEFTDEVGQRLVVGVASDGGAQHGHDVGGGAAPVDEEIARFRVEEGVARNVGRLHGLGMNLGEQRMAELVGGHNIAA